jgi:site-specific recombinase XerD
MKATNGNLVEATNAPQNHLEAQEAAPITQMTYHACVLTRREKAKDNGLTPLYLRITYNK